MFAGFKAFASRIRGWISPRRGSEEFDSELSTHLEMLTSENLARGMSQEEAGRAARIRLGAFSQLREINHDLRGLPMLETFLQDIRFAFRGLRRNPGFSAIAILTLALGIGANAAIFSVVYAVLLKPLPYANASELFTIFQSRPQDGIPVNGWSYLNYEDLREHNDVFVDVAGTQQHQLTLTGHGEPTVAKTSIITPNLFSVCGIPPLAGRAFTEDDGKKGAPPVVILSEGLWRSQFGADPNILGTQIDLDKKPFTVVGIMPGYFRYPVLSETDQLWIPVVDDPLFSAFMPFRSGHWLTLVGRLKAGVSIAQAKTELAAISARQAQQFPDVNAGWTSNMSPLQQMFTRNVKSALLVLLGAVGLVLLIACVNIANLLLTRATSRSRELAVRAALGAGKWRIARQLLNETAVLGLAGGILGIVLAYWGVHALAVLLPPSALPHVNAIRVDKVVLGFALLLSLLASIAFGIAPALFAASANVAGSLREGGARSGEGAGSRRARKVLATLEIAIAMVLLVSAGLLIRSFGRLLSVDPGFTSEHVLKMQVSFPRFEYPKPIQWANFSADLLRRVQAQPGLENTAIGLPMPIVDGNVNLGFDIVGRPSLSKAATQTADYMSVSPEFFHVLGIPLLAGRVFTNDDVMSAPRVMIISKALAQTYFPNENPIGQQMTGFGIPPDPGTPRVIVGIVGDIRDISLGQPPTPMMYAPYAQSPLWGAQIVTKSALTPAAIVAAVQQQAAEIDKDLPVSNVGAMDVGLEDSVAQPRFRTFLLGLFAALALVLAATGIFGVISYSVSCRTNEIGIRVALGASRGTILRMILRETFTLAFFGLLIGLPCALAIAHLLGSLLFGISANDPLTLLIVAVVLAAVAVFAGLTPARRAMRVDPLVALRHE